MARNPDTKENQLIQKMLKANWLDDATIFASHQDIEGGNWKLGLVSELADDHLIAELRELADDCDYPNIFFDLGFLTSSSQWVARHKLQYLILVEQYADQTKLKFFAPVSLERVGRFGPKFLRVWSNEFAPLGMPLIAKSDINRTVEEFHLCMHAVDTEVARGLLINTVPANSAFIKQLTQHKPKKKSIHRFNAYERACLKNIGKEGYLKSRLTGKHRQRLNAARRKLDALGKVEIEQVDQLPSIEVCLLDFMYVEGRGWKGKRNTALINNNETRQLAMSIVRNLAINGKCEIYNLSLDGTVVSSAIFLNSNGYYTAWKIAYNEAYAKYSVGNLLVVHATEEISSRADFKFLDSVALGSNETANRIWPDRLPMISFAMEFGNSGGLVAKQIALNLSTYMRLKRGIKRLLKR